MKRIMLLGGLAYLIPVIKEAHKRGYHVITVDYLPDNIAHKYSDEYYNISTFDKEAILETAKRIGIDGIMSFAVDAGVVSAAYVAEKMGLPFQCSYESACILQDKSLFRKFLAENCFNAPKAKGYTSIDGALKDADLFDWPVIVKPVDSCGSKGVTKVSDQKEFEKALLTAMNVSVNKRFIVEDFLDVNGYQSSADVFAVNGQLVYSTYSDQLFDSEAANPFTPAIEIWPSTMPLDVQDDLTNQLQRLFSLLGIRNGLFNVESRLCQNGKAYLMEVSPRGGGNRIAELQSLATNQDLLAAELNQIMGNPVDIKMPVYNGVWCNYIMHTGQRGVLDSIIIDPKFKQRYVKDESYTLKPGDKVHPFTGANSSLGTLFLRTQTRKEMDGVLSYINDKVKICVSKDDK